MEGLGSKGGRFESWEDLGGLLSLDWIGFISEQKRQSLTTTNSDGFSVRLCRRQTLTPSDFGAFPSTLSRPLHPMGLATMHHIPAK